MLCKTITPLRGTCLWHSVSCAQSIAIKCVHTFFARSSVTDAFTHSLEVLQSSLPKCVGLRRVVCVLPTEEHGSATLIVKTILHSPHTREVHRQAQGDKIRLQEANSQWDLVCKCVGSPLDGLVFVARRDPSWWKSWSSQRIIYCGWCDIELVV